MTKPIAALQLYASALQHQHGALKLNEFILESELKSGCEDFLTVYFCRERDGWRDRGTKKLETSCLGPQLSTSMKVQENRKC